VPARPPDPCTLVLFGATGDLAHRKIVPALFELAKNGELPEPLRQPNGPSLIGHA